MSACQFDRNHSQERTHTMHTMRSTAIVAIATSLILSAAVCAYAQVRPGEVINQSNENQVANLLSPGNYLLVQRGMTMTIVPSQKLDWPPPYRSATEKYQSQVSLGADGSLQNYVAGLPFPLLDPNDPAIAEKIMYNFSYRPQYNDDIDLRYPEIASYGANSTGSPLGFFTVGHFAIYNNVGRIEVPPIPTDPDALNSGIRYRFGFYPFISPASLTGMGLLRYRYIDPNKPDDTFLYDRQSKRVRRESASFLTDALSAVPGFKQGITMPYVNNIDPDSYFGFSGKTTDYNYRFLGERQMLAVVDAVNSPEISCSTDGGRSICPEDWEMRNIYVIEADTKKTNETIPKRILYIDTEGWFITASDQYDRNGALWKTIATFNTYRDRAVPGARVAIYPYRRMFQLGLVDYDVQHNVSSVIFMPGQHTEDRECWYIDMGVTTNAMLTTMSMKNAGH